MRNAVGLPFVCLAVLGAFLGQGYQDHATESALLVAISQAGVCIALLKQDPCYAQVLWGLSQQRKPAERAWEVAGSLVKPSSMVTPLNVSLGYQVEDGTARCTAMNALSFSLAETSEWMS